MLLPNDLRALDAMGYTVRTILEVPLDLGETVIDSRSEAIADTELNGSTQYSVNLPTGAPTGSTLVLDLRGNNDVDLHTRFGARVTGSNTFSGGPGVMADISSTGPEGNETIRLDNLQAGKYFIAVENLDNIVRADYTLQAALLPAGTVVLASGQAVVRMNAPVGFDPTQHAVTVASPVGQVPDTLTIQLAGSGAQDLDLFVRKGKSVLENGRVFFTYRSEGFTGNEIIAVDAASAPPIAQTTYFMTVRNLGPSPASYTLTATVTAKTPITMSLLSAE